MSIEESSQSTVHPASQSMPNDARITRLLKGYIPESPVHRCVLAQADYYCADYDRITLSADQSPFATTVAVSPAATATDYDRIEAALSAVEPQPRRCFANALRLWDEHPDFTYVEGFAVLEDLDHPFKHAWNLVDGTFVDTTSGVDPFDEYYGIVFDDEDLLSHYVDIGQQKDFWGILGNHHDDHQYLRDHGFSN